jgi:hypothetical protein
MTQEEIAGMFSGAVGMVLLVLAVVWAILWLLVPLMRSASKKQFPISNVSDWLPAPAFLKMIELIAKMSAKPARLVWRYLYHNYPVPEGCRAGIRLDEEMGTVLATRDRFPLYGVVPAEIHDIPGDPQTEAGHAR